MQVVRKFLRRAVFVLLLVVLFTARPAYVHARAAALLLRFTAKEGAPAEGLARFGVHEVTEEKATILTPQGQVPARYFVPVGVTDPPGMVVCHGVHHLGIEEPRMKRFARAIASAGVLVLTPELRELADYHVDPRSIGTIGHAARDLTARVHRTGVGVLGLSFAGGLSLLAAADKDYAKDIDFVVSVGGHDDLERVARFFVDDAIPEPDGTTEKLKAHDYGAVVLVYMFVDSFFPNRDAPAAREALRLWLWENFDEAKRAAEKLSPAGQEKIKLVFDHREDLLRPEILRLIEAHREDMRKVSPHGNLAGLRARAFLLHGAGDSVIPASETRWLAHDAPPGSVEQALVSPALVHVDLENEPSTREQLDIVDFLASVIQRADDEAPQGE